jgi:hypothetical protein
MTSRHDGIGTPLAVVVVVIVVIVIGVISAAVLTAQTGSPPGGTSSSSNPRPSTSSSLFTSTSSTALNASTSVTCIQSGIRGSLQVRVVSDNSGQPVEGANITATILDNCESGYNQPNSLGLTNSTGYAPSLVGWTGSITVSVTYAGAEYTFQAQINAQIVATLSIPSGVAVEQTIGCGGLPGCSLTATTFTASSVLHVPPPTTTVVHYGCGISTASSTKTSALVLVNTSKVNNINVNVSVSPALTLSAAACSHTFTNTTTPTACGVMCDGGIGYTYAISDVWKLNFSLSSPVTSGGYNLTIAAGSGMSDLFPGLSTEIYLNSQQITAWYSNPPCYGDQGVESNCMSSEATSITIELPAPIQGGEYQLMITSGEYLVP